ncbi:hypothetical protein NC651_015282 [Populus alba x Populus x berolinensis]|uniref:Uncharacterized protein n=1 Tax=Populus alba x Populus x berolinensis TaxID=444605 RepID=A0AAD6QLD3_9ROSI|nr:hypothetical protein NC651_015282 [Populus alba x Populus x berolinensis]KAJ6992450.1 hypothetical protein NC653_015745 [Populus alba x Populus x berolinensis]
MELKKISCAVLVVAASMSAALAADEISAPAPSPTSGASATLPVQKVGGGEFYEEQEKQNQKLLFQSAQ